MSLRNEIESLKRYEPVNYGYSSGPREALMAEIKGGQYVTIEDVLRVVDAYGDAVAASWFDVTDDSEEQKR